MQYSVNEIENLLTKAARGAGAPAAQAAAFGQAGALHIARACDPADVQAALTALPVGPILEHPRNLQRVLAKGGGVVNCALRDLLRSYAVALPYFVAESDSAVEFYLDKFAKTPRPPRITVDAAHITTWRALAAQTFVPETEGSRLGGAGAGLTDND